MKRNALVEEISGKRATVSFLREEACAGCSGRHICANSKKTKATVDNSLGAEVGDTVEIETETSSLLMYAAILFLAPVLLALMMYLAFVNVNTVLAYSMTAVGFLLPYPIAALLNYKRRDSLPVITSVVKKPDEAVGTDARCLEK